MTYDPKDRAIAVAELRERMESERTTRHDSDPGHWHNGGMPKPRKPTRQDIADIRGALDFAQDRARAHGDDFRLAFRKADRALDRIVTELFAKRR
jgi:hypothetical protein